MAKHSANSAERVDDWDARIRINDTLSELVIEADVEAEESTYVNARHSTGRIDYDAELEALAYWFGIE